MARDLNAWLAEIVGTFLLVFIGSGAGVLAPASTGALVPAFSHGLALFVIVVIIGRISGAHANPAVTLALASIGKFSWLRVPGYIVSQFIGAFLGALGVAVIYNVMPKVNPSVAPTMAAGVGMGTGLLAEALGAGILVIAVVAAVADSRIGLAGGVAGLAIGLALASAIFVIGPVTGAAVNPALGLSPFAVNTIFHYTPELTTTSLVVYLVGPIVGGVIAAWIYRIISAMPADRPVRSKQPVAAKKR